MMTWVFAGLGAVIAFMFAWGAAAEATVRLWDRILWLYEDHVARKLGDRIAGEAYWFSESVEAMEALKAVGNHLQRNGSFRIYESRDEWRSAMAKVREPKEKP